MGSNKLVHIIIMIASYNGDNTWTVTDLLLAVESLEGGASE